MDTTAASRPMWGGEIIIAFDTKTARGMIGSEPVAVPRMPNQEDRRVSKILWSMVSKAAEKAETRNFT